ncbi:MAG: hypothetical protein ACXVBG_20680 [Isosphaeraceae bacterium]
MAAPFAHELGVFNATFPGITLHFPNKETWQKLREVTELNYRLTKRDLLRRNPGMSVTDLDPARMMEQFLGNAEIGINLSPDEKDAIGREFIANDPGNAVGNLALATAFEHERRHFHDWLLSPYTAAINQIRSEAFVNYSALRGALRANGTTVIPVPLSRWFRKSEAERQALVDSFQSILGDAARVQLPDFTQPGVTAVVDAITRRYRSIGMLFKPIAGTQADGAAIFEASALLIQTQAIHDLFGETASNLFRNAMAGLPPPSRYGWFPQAMAALRRPGEILENDTLSAIATWCLLGNTTADSANAHPLIRVNHAVRCVEARGFSNLDKPTGEIFEELDGSSGAMPYRDLLEHSIELGGSIVEHWEKMVEEDRSGSNFLQGIVQAQTFLHKCHVYMARLFMDDPDGYCQPVGYLDRSLEKLPEPPLRQTFGTPFYSVKRSMLDQYDKVTLFEKASTPDDAFLQQTIAQLPKGVIDLEIADNWQYLCELVDTVFAENNREYPEIEVQKARARKSGIYYMDILS